MLVYHVIGLSLLVTFQLVYRSDACGCHKGWSLAYAHNADGTTISGDKIELIQAILTGADIRIYIPTWRYLTSIQNTHTVGNNLCGQALFHVSKAAYDTFQDNAYYYLMNLCSTGHVHMVRYYVGSHVSAGNNEDNVGMQWFIRKHEKSIYSHDQDGAVLTGSVDDVISAMEVGADLRIVEEQLGYSVRMDSLEMAANRSLVAGQSLWHISQTSSGPNMKFQGNDYWWFTIWSTDGMVDVTRWNVGEHVNRGDSIMHRPLTWYADSCWQMAYKHDGDGNLLDGSLEFLRSAVEAGHRIKLLIDGVTTVEPDQITIRGGHVNAQIISLIAKESAQSFINDVYWDWRVLTTTGTETSIYYDVGEHVSRGTSTKNRSITWFIDTRAWNRVLANDKDGNVLAGTKEALTDAILSGAEVRYKLALPENTGIFQADNLAISADGNVGAMHVRSVSLTFTSGSAHEVKFQNNPYWWFTIASTTGKLEMSRWTVGEHVDRGHTNSAFGMEWYVSY